MSFIDFFNDEFYKYVNDNIDKNVHTLALTTKKDKLKFSFEAALIQIKCRNKTSRKLSYWIKNNKFIFPTSLSAEQCSHESVALYHSFLIGKGLKVLDMTSGLGIDALTCAEYGNYVTAIDIDEIKTEVLAYNAKNLNIPNINSINSDSIDFLFNNNDKVYDVIFIDPARRHNDNSRVYGFVDSQPDIIKNFNLLKKSCKRLLIKGSPMLDITQVIKEIPFISEIHIVLVKGECKEVLIICDFEESKKSDNKKEPKDIKIIVIDLNDFYKKDIDIKNVDFERLVINRWECSANDWGQCDVFTECDDIKEGYYLYDPNAGLHKLDVSKKLCSEFSNLKKLSPNTELYFSEVHYPNFPGKIFKINKILDKKYLKALKHEKREVAVRNYVESSDNLRRHLKLKPGSGNLFIYGFKVGIEEKPLLVECERFLE